MNSENRFQNSSMDDDKSPRRMRGKRPRKFMRRKVCVFCVQGINEVDYKDVNRLRRYVSDRGKILPRRISGNCAHHQRILTRAIKRARTIALIPYKADL